MPEDQPRKLITQPHYLGPSVKLFKEDIETIINIMEDACEKVVIQDGQFEYPSLDVLRKTQGERIIKITVKGYRPEVTLSLDYYDSLEVYSEDASDATHAAFTKINQILLLRQRRFLSAETLLLGLLASGIIFLVAGIIGLDISSVIVLLLVVAGGCAWVSAFVDKGGFSVLLLRPSKESQGFWYRNRDKVFVSLITAALTLLLSYLAKRVLK